MRGRVTQALRFLRARHIRCVYEHASTPFQHAKEFAEGSGVEAGFPPVVLVGDLLIQRQEGYLSDRAGAGKAGV